MQNKTINAWSFTIKEIQDIREGLKAGMTTREVAQLVNMTHVGVSKWAFICADLKSGRTRSEVPNSDGTPFVPFRTQKDGKSKMPKDVLEKITAMTDPNVSIRDIVKALNINQYYEHPDRAYSAVHKYVKRWKLPFCADRSYAKTTSKITDIQKLDIERLHKEGMSVEDITKKLDIAKNYGTFSAALGGVQRFITKLKVEAPAQATAPAEAPVAKPKYNGRRFTTEETKLGHVRSLETRRKLSDSETHQVYDFLKDGHTIREASDKFPEIVKRYRNRSSAESAFRKIAKGELYQHLPMPNLNIKDGRVIADGAFRKVAKQETPKPIATEEAVKEALNKTEIVPPKVEYDLPYIHGLIKKAFVETEKENSMLLLENKQLKSLVSELSLQLHNATK